jgi:hypothetical protein
MKRKLFRWALVGWGVLVGWQATAGLLKNDSFETPLSPDATDQAADWGRWGNWINRENTWTPTRTGASLIGYHHWRIEENDSSGVYQDVPDLEAKTPVEFSIYVFTDIEANCDNVEVRLEPMGGGEAIASRVYALSELKVGDWQELYVRGTNTEAGIRVLFTVKPKPSGDRKGAVKFDDPRLVKK